MRIAPTVAFILAVAMAAWMFRYAPISQSLVWDRWEQRVCSVELWQGGVTCDVEQPHAESTSSIAPGLKEYQRLIAAGFSSQEVDTWKAERTQKLRAAGFTQKEIADYFGD